MKFKRAYSQQQSGKQPLFNDPPDSYDNEAKDEAVKRCRLLYCINEKLTIVVLPDSGFVLQLTPRALMHSENRFARQRGNCAHVRRQGW
jgi:hypothetical protein